MIVSRSDVAPLADGTCGGWAAAGSVVFLVAVAAACSPVNFGCALGSIGGRLTLAHADSRPAANTPQTSPARGFAPPELAPLRRSGARSDVKLNPRSIAVPSRRSTRHLKPDRQEWQRSSFLRPRKSKPRARALRRPPGQEARPSGLSRLECPGVTHVTMTSIPKQLQSSAPSVVVRSWPPPRQPEFGALPGNVPAIPLVCPRSALAPGRTAARPA